MRFRAIALLVAVSVTVAVFPVPARAITQSEMDRDLAEIRNYRLTMEKIRKVGDVYQALYRSLEANPQFQKVARAKTELKALDEKDELTESEEARREQLSQEIEQGEDALESLSVSFDAGANKTLADLTRAIERSPVVAAAIGQAGLSAREFATLQLALFQSMFAYGFKKSGVVKELPKEVSAENVKFLEEHEKEIEAMAKEWEKLRSKPPAR